MIGVPESAVESLVPHNVVVRESSLDIGYANPLTGEFEFLTLPQLAEVAAVYNAWRCGNLQDCTIRNESHLLRVKL